MRYQISMSGGEKYWITEDEAKHVAETTAKGLVFVPSLQGFLNLSFVSGVIPESNIDRSKITAGRLHDGTRVIRQFGRWVDAENPKLMFDPKYYPEVAEDTVESEDDFQKRTAQGIPLLVEQGKGQIGPSCRLPRPDSDIHSVGEEIARRGTAAEVIE